MTATYGVADVESVLSVAKRYPVFPCGPNKQPRVKGGFHAATQDVAQIRAWWRQWPDSLVGVPTGQGTGLVVIDYDPDKANSATHSWIAEHTDLLLSTRTHKTGRGGLHYLFQSRERYQTGTDLVLDGSPRRGIDLRASGGYIIWWPIHTGQAIDSPIAALPAALIDERRFDRERDLAPLPKATPGEWSRERTRVVDALTHLSPNGYEPWIRIGMALHYASGGSDDGFALWHEWSAQGESYDGIEDCRYHWASFGRHGGRGVGLGSLYASAKSAGWSYVRQIAEPPPMEFAPIEAYEDEPDGEPVAEEPEAANEPQLSFRHISEIVAEQREPEWLIEDVIEANVLAVLAGKRGTYKSFVALDWSMRIARTIGPVVILSGEGAGLDRRADAWMRTHAPAESIADVALYALEKAVNLNAELDMALIVSAASRMPAPPVMIVVDTFSKFSAGLDENDNGEVSAYLAKLSASLRDRFSCTVLIVAHTGHADGGRPRGASALMANPDAEYIANRASPLVPYVAVSRERFKDTPALEPVNYEAKVVDLGRADRRGRPITSLALLTTDVEVMPRKAARPQGKNQHTLLKALRELQQGAESALIWTIGELRKVARTCGLEKSAAAKAAEGLALSQFMVATVGGYRLANEGELSCR